MRTTVRFLQQRDGTASSWVHQNHHAFLIAMTILEMVEMSLEARVIGIAINYENSNKYVY